MENQELKSKKRKRKHASVATDSVPLSSSKEALSVLPSVNGDARSERHKEPKKRKHKREENSGTLHKANGNGETTPDQHDYTTTESLKKEEEGMREQHAHQSVAEDLLNGTETSEVSIISQATAEDDGDAEGYEKPPAAVDMPAASTLSLPSVGQEPKNFADLDLSTKTMEAIKGMGFEQVTEIQQRGIPPLLAGRDVLGAAKTGSGKTLGMWIRRYQSGRKDELLSR